MSLVIRMSLKGRTNRPFFRIGVWDNRSRRDGPPIEYLGWYDPMARDAAKQFVVQGERVTHYFGLGAQVSDTMRSVLKKAKVAVPPRKTARTLATKDAKRRAAAAARRGTTKVAVAAKPAKKKG